MENWLDNDRISVAGNFMINGFFCIHKKQPCVDLLGLSIC